MKPLKVSGINFQSYEEITFDYDDLGAALIVGPTGSGKSTVLDLLCWTLYGVTSKDSAADDVRSWLSDEPTAGMATVQLRNGGTIDITRLRGKRSAQNDLFFTEAGGVEQRGKDAKDTQKKIDAILGVSGPLFTNAAYIHQFSKSDTFFVAEAKYRREIIETIKDLSAPVKFAERCKLKKVELKALALGAEKDVSRIQGAIMAMSQTCTNLEAEKIRFEQNRERRVASLAIAAEEFEENRNARISAIVDQLEELDKITEDDGSFAKRIKSTSDQIKKAEAIVKEARQLKSDVAVMQSEIWAADKALSEMYRLGQFCPVCKGPADNVHGVVYREELEAKVAQLRESMAVAMKELVAKSQVESQHQQLSQSLISLNRKQADNARLLDRFDSLKAQTQVIADEKSTHQIQIDELKAQENPYVAQIEKASEKVDILDKELASRRAVEKTFRESLASVEWLYDCSFKAKALMLTDAIGRLQDRTNEILSTYFDGALRVLMSIDDGDKVEVEIQNDGYECPFRQLSGGERCMLKLAFNVAYMEAAQDCAGVHVDTIMLDEALNGLDSDLKVKAYGLIEHLAERHGTVLCIEHSDEFKLMFHKTFSVHKEGSKSVVSESV